MSTCRFMHQNLITGPDMLDVSSALSGPVGMPAPRAAGSAVAYAGGQHSASRDQAFLLEIDSVGAGAEVGQATFRWKRGQIQSWEGAGLATSTAMTELTDGVSVKWVSGIGDDFVLGDGWTIVCPANEGPVRLLDGDRDTLWKTTGCAAEHLTVDLGAATAATSLILADHNLSDSATVNLLADDGADWGDPAFSTAVTVNRPHLAAFFEHTARYWRLEISDPANADGYVSASMLHLGPSPEPVAQFQRPLRPHPGRRTAAQRHRRGQGGRLGQGPGPQFHPALQRSQRQRRVRSGADALGSPRRRRGQAAAPVLHAPGQRPGRHLLLPARRRTGPERPAPGPLVGQPGPGGSGADQCIA